MGAETLWEARMNCPEWEERIAAGEPDEAADGHLAGCAACREFAAEIESAVAVLRAAHAGEIAPAHYAAVRARVWARIGERRRKLMWRLALAAAVLIALLYPALERWRTPQSSAPLRVAVRTPEIAAPAAGEPVLRAGGTAGARASARRHAIPQPRLQARPQRPRQPRRQPLLIKLLTDDPNVVIYWVAE
jgi:hypothetical protein